MKRAREGTRRTDCKAVILHVGGWWWSDISPPGHGFFEVIPDGIKHCNLPSPSGSMLIHNAALVCLLVRLDQHRLGSKSMALFSLFDYAGSNGLAGLVV